MADGNSDDLTGFLQRHARLAVLTGAGCSTASGIPEYRDDLGEWKHARPVQYADFLRDSAVRQRYWARSFSGWQRVTSAVPNAAHTALAALEQAGRLTGLITQNVDNLHRRAGSRHVLDLHGTLDRVRCLQCTDTQRRAAIQERMAADNPGWQNAEPVSLPDGDAELGDAIVTAFRVPDCELCGGILKPDVVFFGESVPAERVTRARRMVSDADALLVVGSSLTVFSGYRFVRQASSAGMPIAIVNRGTTRGDELASLRVHGDCGDLLSTACRELTIGAAAAYTG
jgi:NAD-dependent SIR2 family protein deacetylase